MKHYTEADLLETYYMQPGASMPVMMHLAGCADCQTRYERLERKLRSLASREAEKPETFWSRQRHGIMRRVAQQRAHAPRPMRVAAAAVLAFVLGGVAMWKSVDRPAVPQPVATATANPAAPATTEVAVPADPWQSDELNEYQSMVAWESWGEPSPTKGES